MIDRSIPRGYGPGPESLNRELMARSPPLRVVFNYWANAFEIQEWLTMGRRWSYVRLWASIDRRGRPRGFMCLPVGPGPIVAAVHGCGVDELDCARTTDVSILKDGHTSLQARRDAGKKKHDAWIAEQWKDMRAGVNVADFENRGFGRKVTIGMGKGSSPRSTRYIQSLADEQKKAVETVRRKVGTLR